MKIEEVHEKGNKILNEVGKAIVGKTEVLKLILATILADGHILIEDLPGLAKTLMAKSFAAALGVNFRRVQFTPDLLPSDILGVSVFNQKSLEFEFKKGPIFTNILLADEVNRAPPKTQSALLEAMQERQVTIEGKTYYLEKPFVVIATQNPIEQEGTYPLPEAQLDRFLVRLRVGYPTKEEEVEILKRRIGRKKEEVDINQVSSAEEITEMQKAIEEVYISDAVLDYITEIVRATRENKREIEVGASPRGSLALLRLSRAYAALEGRDYVIPDDVKKVAIPALSHRLILKRELWYTRVSQEMVMEKMLEKIPVPKFE
ncbi:MAG: Methanol dehydrogenase regulatory protein [Thermococcales archaeon 44_46]|jgi:MoxR-like ATPase|uniref:AAA family ATPase n=1 Tax=Thermococcus sp. PK TaxID=913025 RepID=UPI0005B2DAB9|nr:MoxR family ATPase [Thermococcus sp. PK]KUJ98967.1 MAG: Methanol dehydrogenase regulatory protein [Thermococcales archaeon 44_46]MBC7109167.1 MoxR family ATPase [Methanomassiliicoccales archaeon]HIH73020.1 MoxR family ATPase [Thermococcaceae archaeon]